MAPPRILLACLVLAGGVSGAVSSGPSPDDRGIEAAQKRLETASAGTASVRLHPATGVARRVRLAPGSIELDGATPADRARDFLRRHGGVFGVRDADAELDLAGTWTDGLGQTHVRFVQVYRGIPVFAGELRAHTDRQGRLVEVHGSFVPWLDLDPRPRLTPDEAGERAVARVRDDLPNAGAGALAVRGSRLLVFETGLVQRVPGEAHLAWEIEVGNGADVREFVYVDAATGKVLDRISGIHSAIHRTVYEPAFQNVLIWNEGQSLPYFTGNADNDVQVNDLIESAADVYGMFLNLSGGAFPSWDGHDSTLHSVWNIGTNICPNAFWNGVSTNFCYGVAADDSTIHEWVHAYTESTHNLIYQWQPGALNESYSDIYGELLDLLNGNGTDSPVGPRSAGACSTYGGSPAPQLEVLSPAAIAGIQRGGGATFNPPGPLTVAGLVQLVNDGTSPNADACQPLVGFVPGRLALVDRGTCASTTKVLNAQNAGAVGVIVVNLTGNYAQRMTGSAPAITIPSVMIGNEEGNRIKAQLGVGVNARLRVVPATDASLRFLLGEDDSAFGGAIRDLWAPDCFADPDRVSDRAFYICDTSDGGGVHTNSGVPNHAFALLLDGGTFNGHTVAALGPTRVAHLYWRAMSVYQVADTDFADHADALEQSCADLIGAPLVHPVTGAPTGQAISASDCTQVAEALAAVELRDPPAYCNFQPLLAPNAPPASCGSVTLFEDFESDPGATWSRSNFGVYAEYTPRDWVWTASIPQGRTGSAIFALDDRNLGDCVPGSDDQSGAMRIESPPLVLDTDHALLTFDHWVATEPGFDGGNVSVSVNGGPYQLVPGSAFSFNPYNTTLQSAAAGNTSPLAGQPAFSGTDGGTVDGSWGQSQVNLSTLATALDTVRLRFDFGVDGCNGQRGWYVDDVRVCGNCAGAGGLDLDADGFRSCDGDCDPSNPATFPGAPEVNDGLDNECPGSAGFGLVDEISGDAGFHDAGDTSRYSWDPQPAATSYEVARASSPDFVAGCTTFTSASAFVVDPQVPGPDAAFHYLVRPLTPHEGSWGAGRAVPCAAP